MYKPPYSHLLFTPGPVPLPPWVKEKLALDIIHHRSPEFKLVFKRVLERLKIFFQTEEPVLIQNSTGTGVMEASLLNTLSPGEEVLSIVSGKFGERWDEIARSFSLKAHRFDVDFGKPLNLKELEKALKKRKTPPRALLCQASETSTGTLHPIKKISALLSSLWPPQSSSSLRPLLIVDAMTALGATPLPMDEWDLDVVMTSSQKALMLPPGIAFISLSKKAWNWNKRSRFPKFYFNLKKELEANEKKETAFSASVTHILALDAVLERVATKKEDLLQMIEDCERKAKLTRTFLKSLSLKLFSEIPTPSVTAFKLPNTFDPALFKKYLKSKYNITLASGEKGTLRISHIGFMRDQDLEFALDSIKKSLRDFPLSSSFSSSSSSSSSSS